MTRRSDFGREEGGWPQPSVALGPSVAVGENSFGHHLGKVWWGEEHLCSKLSICLVFLDRKGSESSELT